MIFRAKAFGVLLFTTAVLSGFLQAQSTELRNMAYVSGSEEQAIAWQEDVRFQLFSLLKMDDLIATDSPLDFAPQTISSEKRDDCVYQEIEINSTEGRRVRIILTIPTEGKGPFPAVVCIAGHSGTRLTCYDQERLYKRFGTILAQSGYVTISVNVGQHDTYEEDRTLMGERLWDLMRCVDYLESMDEVDPQKIGCGGLSLGGEMTMWLGAMDTRIQASVSAGFLTRMDQMEQNHCMCWKFPGLRERVDFVDIYALHAPRALLCQNGLQEPASQFPVPLALEALAEIKPIYQDFDVPENLTHTAHDGGHEIDMPSLVAFFDEHLGE